MKIERSLVFERHLLVGQQGSQNARRPKQAHLALPPQPTGVPIGARGRKRKTMVLLSVVCAPNPDGRRQYATPPIYQQASGMSYQQTTNSENRQVNTSTSSLRQPAKRTYARASSTPFASSTVRQRPRALSFPAPDESVTNPSPNESLIDVDFVGFGRLHYDSSDTE